MSSQEYELVRLAARASLAPDRARSLGAVSRGGLEWDRTLELAARHRVLPLLYAHLRDYGQAPDHVLERLRANALRRAADVAFLTADMARIGRRLEAVGVPYLVLKGPSLSEAYVGSGVRPFSDNDILVRRSDFRGIEDALTDLGFRQRKRSARQQAGYLLIYGEYTFGRSEGPFVSTVDVHTRIVPPGLPFAPSFSEVLGRSRTIKVAGHPVPALSWEDLFLTLSVNALKDQWGRLRLATDLAAAARFVDDWDAVEDRARDGRHLRALHLSVLATSRLVGGGFPSILVEDARRDSRAVALADLVCESMRRSEADPTLPLVDRARLNLTVQDGVTGSLRYAGYTLVRRALGWSVDPRR